VSLFLRDKNHPFSGLSGGYDFIMADPPWTFKSGISTKSAGSKYKTMPTAAICALPVIDICAEDCVLWLWVTAPMLPEGLETLSAWGFEYKTHGVWLKQSANKGFRVGTGFWLRSCHETLLLGTRGKPNVQDHSILSAFWGEAREHSRKPESAYEVAKKIRPQAKRLDLFSREAREGWDNWGHEKTKFNEEALA
jgi:N6-adenosine-specific RNA methylase IME4